MCFSGAENELVELVLFLLDTIAEILFPFYFHKNSYNIKYGAIPIKTYMIYVLIGSLYKFSVIG